jgi:hypothetical protein
MDRRFAGYLRVLCRYQRWVSHPLPGLFTVAEEKKGKKLINSMLGIDGYTPGFTWQWVDKNTPLTVLLH